MLVIIFIFILIFVLGRRPLGGGGGGAGRAGGSVVDGFDSVEPGGGAGLNLFVTGAVEGGQTGLRTATAWASDSWVVTRPDALGIVATVGVERGFVGAGVTEGLTAG